MFGLSNLKRNFPAIAIALIVTVAGCTTFATFTTRNVPPRYTDYPEVTKSEMFVSVYNDNILKSTSDLLNAMDCMDLLEEMGIVFSRSDRSEIDALYLQQRYWVALATVQLYNNQLTESKRSADKATKAVNGIIEILIKAKKSVVF